MLALSAGASWVGLLSLREYLAFPQVVVFSTGAICLIFSCMVILPLTLAGFYTAVKGQRLPEKKSYRLFRWFIGGLIIAVVSGFTFKFYYQYQLKERGYAACKGIPTGWMPGLSTKYALNDALCRQKK